MVGCNQNEIEIKYRYASLQQAPRVEHGMMEVRLTISFFRETVYYDYQGASVLGYVL